MVEVKQRSQVNALHVGTCDLEATNFLAVVFCDPSKIFSGAPIPCNSNPAMTALTVGGRQKGVPRRQRSVQANLNLRQVLPEMHLKLQKFKDSTR